MTATGTLYTARRVITMDPARASATAVLVTGDPGSPTSTQRISVHDALRAVTIDAAYSWRMEDELGSITPGKAANFTVLAEDPYAVEPERLNEIAVLGTVYEGRWFPRER